MYNPAESPTTSKTYSTDSTRLEKIAGKLDRIIELLEGLQADREQLWQKRGSFSHKSTEREATTN